MRLHEVAQNGKEYCGVVHDPPKKSGDPDWIHPYDNKDNGGYCSSIWEGYFCTRKQGHDGHHLGGYGVHTNAMYAAEWWENPTATSSVYVLIFDSGDKQLLYKFLKDCSTPSKTLIPDWDKEYSPYLLHLQKIFRSVILDFAKNKLSTGGKQNGQGVQESSGE